MIMMTAQDSVLSLPVLQLGDSMLQLKVIAVAVALAFVITRFSLPRRKSRKIK